MAYDPWSTHVAALAYAINKYGKRILECGCGWYSTPMIYTISDCALSIEENPDYVRPFEKLCPGKIIHSPWVVDEAFRLATKQEWDVVFIDCHNWVDRVLIATFFLNRKTCIVAHDTEADYWKPLLLTVKYQRHFDLMSPRTSLLSNVIPVCE